MNYYNILGIDKKATPDDIKKAYRRLASQHHPDKGGDTSKFQEIQTAYETLCDPVKKQQYDNPVHIRGQNGFEFNFNPDNINDILHQFGGIHNIFNQNRGLQTFRTIVQLSLMDAYQGVKKALQIHTNTGSSIISIDIPKGIMSGQQIKYEQLIPNANLLVEFVVQPDLHYDRQMHDLYSNVPISIFKLITGTTLNFTTISGKMLEIEVKPITQPHMQLKLIGQGMPIINSSKFGDQILLLKPFIPDTIHSDIVDILNKHKE